MRYQLLGSTDLRVSALCLGTWQLSGQWGADISGAIEAVRRAFDHGINFFDSAYSYGDGASEEALSRSLADLLRSHREEIVLCSKGGLEHRRGASVRNSEPAFLKASLENSLRALRTDYVDIYAVHWPDPLVPLEETAFVLDEFVRKGLVRQVGVSNFSVQEMERFASAGRLDVAQVPYNIFDRRAELEVLPYCQQRGIGVMGWGALAHGLLTGSLSVDQQFAPDDIRSRFPAFERDELHKRLRLVDRLRRIAVVHGCTVAQLAVGWVGSHSANVVPIIGAQRPQHLIESARGIDLALSASERDQIDLLGRGAPPLDLIPGGPPRRPTRHAT